MELRVRILCASHCIRPKALSAWNAQMEWIKLVSSKKDELIIEFILRDNVPVEALWFFGWGLARHFVVALNIGTMGFWWRRMPEQISRYYESIEDLETHRPIAVERRPSLKIDWGVSAKLQVLSCQHAALVCWICPRMVGYGHPVIRAHASTPAAIDIQDGTCHEAVRHQEKDRMGDVIGSADAANRECAGNTVEMSSHLRLRETRTPERCIDLTRCDRVNTNRRQLERHSASERLNGGIDRSQRRHFDSRLTTNPTREEHDGSVRGHSRRRVFQAVML